MEKGGSDAMLCRYMRKGICSIICTRAFPSSLSFLNLKYILIYTIIMASVLKTTISFFFSTIPYCFFGYRPKTAVNVRYYTMPKTRPLSLQTVELKVRMCCSGCERVVKDAILKLRGVDSVEVELNMEKVTVVGYVDRNKVLKTVRRAGKRAEFWPYPNPPLYFTSSANYFKDLTNDYKESYNYYRHGYNVGDRHGTIPISSRGDDRVSNMFNDDNVNACNLM